MEAVIHALCRDIADIYRHQPSQSDTTKLLTAECSLGILNGMLQAALYLKASGIAHEAADFLNFDAYLKLIDRMGDGYPDNPLGKKAIRQARSGLSYLPGLKDREQDENAARLFDLYMSKARHLHSAARHHGAPGQPQANSASRVGAMMAAIGLRKP